MTDRLFIFYHPGAYGSWVEWVIQRCHADFARFTKPSPLQEDGSSHRHTRLMDYDISHPQGHQSILKSLEYRDDVPLLTFRAIPKTSINEDAAEIMNHAAASVNCIYISVGNDRMRELVLLNADKKIQPYARQLSEIDQIRQWNSDAQSIDDLAAWEIREYLSLHYYTSIKDMTELTQPLDDSILTLDVSEILDDAESMVMKIFDRFRLPLLQDNIPSIKQEHAKMLRLQDSLRELEAIDSSIAACLGGQDVAIPEISLLAQAIMQKRLRDLGYEMRCYGLNQWPTSTAALHKLLVL